VIWFEHNHLLTFIIYYYISLRYNLIFLLTFLVYCFLNKRIFFMYKRQMVKKTRGFL
jgi:hypothetical protein